MPKVQQPYSNIFLQLRNWVLNEINNIISKLPKTIPCEVITNNGQTVNVKPLVNVGVTNQIIQTVPIAKSKYLNIPFQAGDRGSLVPSNYIYSDLVLTSLGFISDPKESTSRSGYLFIPFTNYAQDYSGVNVNNNMQLFSQSGASSIKISNTDITLTTNEAILWSKLKTFLDDLKLSYNNNVITENANLASIQTQLTALGKPATITYLSQFTEDYRS